MAKKIEKRPEWLKANHVIDIFSVSGCVSDDFADWINYWKHNGYWFFDSPQVIVDLSIDHQIDLSKVRWFYYEIYDKQYDEDDGWIDIIPEKSFHTDVAAPDSPTLIGYDVVTYSCGTSAECSPLSCNHLAEHKDVNEHCLLNTFEEAIKAIESDEFKDCEPGPLRIFSVYEIPDPIKNLTEPAG